MEVQAIGERFRDVQVPAGHVGAAVHDLGQDLSSVETDVKPHKRKVSAPRRVTNQLNHKRRLAAISASAGFAGARHPAPKFSVPRCSANEVIMPRRRRGGLHGLTLPCPAPAVNLDNQVGALPAPAESRHRTQAPLASLLVLH